jgi:23S rRNA (guanosine2251-2'-O)-methyltransferase
MSSDSPEYIAKKAHFDRMLTIYGRKPVLEALQTRCKIERLHLSSRNKSAAILDEIVHLAKEQGAEILEHSPQALSRISKNAKQDQGVAADIACPNFMTLEQLIESKGQTQRVIALDRITNPQNLGMIIRSVTASRFDALLIPRKGCAALSPLVIKASAGTLLKAPIVQVDSLSAALKTLKAASHQLYSMNLSAKHTLANRPEMDYETFVLGNETDGVSPEINTLCGQAVKIPMQRGVESLNVAVTAALICFSID